jgi:hypothetical protein
VVFGDVAGDVVVPGARHASLLDLQGAAAERSARELDRAPGKLAPALGVDREGAAQRVEAEERVRAGISWMLAIADCGNRSQLTISPNGLVDAHAVLEHREPWGTPTRGEAVNPRKLMSGW